MPRIGQIGRRPDEEIAVAARAPERVITTRMTPGDSVPVPAGRGRLDAIETPLPSDYMRAGWMRGKGLAMNRHGDRLVNTALDDPEGPGDARRLRGGV